MKKTLALVLTAVVSTGMFAGCTKGGTTGNKSNVSLTVLTNRTDIVDTYLKDYADQYKKDTGVTIKWEAITNYYDDVKVRMNSKNYGDALYIPTGVALSELEQFFEPLGKNTDDKNKKYAYNTSYAVKNENAGDYTVYGLTYGLNATGIVYNKAAFKKAGVDKVPTTLDELYTAAGKLAGAGIIPMGINFKDKWPLSNWDVVGMIASGNGNFWNEMINDTAPFTADKPLGRSMEILYKFVNSGWVEKDLATTNWEQSKADLGQGKMGMMPLGTWAISQVQGFANNKDDIGYMAFPTDNSGKLYSATSGDMFMAVNKNSSHKKEATDLLYAFIDSKYADDQGFIPSDTTKVSTNTTIKDFMSSGVNLLQQLDGQKGNEADIRQKIANEAGIDVNGSGNYEQNVALAAKKGRTDFESAIADLNTRWANAKKKLGF